jgi:cell division protein FtsN
MTGSGDRQTPRAARLDSAPMRPAPRSVRAVLSCVAVAASATLVLSGCGGGDETITPEEADSVKESLENARDTADKGKCDESLEYVEEAETRLAALDLSGDAGATADELMDRTSELISEDCVPVATTVPEEPVPTETFEEPTTSSTAEETTTDTTTTTETEPPEVEEEPPGPPETPPGPPETPPGQDDDDDDGGTGGAVSPDRSTKPTKDKGESKPKPKHGKGKEEGKKK